MKLLLLSCLLCLLSLSGLTASPHRFLPASSRSLFSFRNARERIQSSARKNYINYWHFKGQTTTPATSQPSLPSQPAAPAVTNTRTNNVDQGLLRSSRPAPVPITPSDWVSVVPSRLSSAPSQTASIRWPRFSPGVGDTMITGQMKDRPSITWSAQSSDLFTIMILDEGIAFLNGQQYAHWVVTNVPGDGDILEGTEMMRYVEPFSANPDDPKHPMLVLVFRQQGRLEFEEYQRGCSPSIISDRTTYQRNRF